ncbi:unnamed protein product [Umbelopsis ramanniana]
MKAFYTATLLVAAAVFVNAADVDEKTAGKALKDAVLSEESSMPAVDVGVVSDDMPDFWQMDEAVGVAGTHTVEGVLASAAEAAEEAVESAKPLEKNHKHHHHGSSSSAAAPEESNAAEFNAEIDSTQDGALASPDAQSPPADVEGTRSVSPEQKDAPSANIVESIKHFFNKLRGVSN